MSEQIGPVPQNPDITFEETVAWALHQQPREQLTPDLRKRWIKEHFCTVAELGRITNLLNGYKKAEQETHKSAEVSPDSTGS